MRVLALIGALLSLATTAACSSRAVTLDEGDTGGQVMVSVGDDLHVWLGGVGADAWGEPTVTTGMDAVQFIDADTCRTPGAPTPSGGYECMYRFEAVHQGTAEIEVPYIGQNPEHPSFSLSVIVHE